MANSIRTNIRTAVKTALKTIIAGNDNGNGWTYNSTIVNNNIGIPPRSIEDMMEFPFINFDFGEERAANAEVGSSLQTGGANKQLLHNSVDAMCDCFMKADDQTLAQDKILADLQALFGQNYSIDNTVFNTIYSRSIPFGVENNNPNCGITVYFRIWYRIYSSNPAISG